MNKNKMIAYHIVISNLINIFFTIPQKSILIFSTTAFVISLLINLKIFAIN